MEEMLDAMEDKGFCQTQEIYLRAYFEKVLNEFHGKPQNDG